MVKLKLFFIFFFLLTILFSCNENTSGILPEDNLEYLEKYHCWPYDVKIYSINEIKIDSLFYSYPLINYFGENPKYKITTWTKYNKIDTPIWNGMSKMFKECDDLQLYKQILNGNKIYYTGIYQNFKVLNGEKRRKYEKILFLDLKNKKIHIFKDINKVY